MTAPPTRYPSSGTFDVGRYDGVDLGTNYCSPDLALESAYPSSPDAEPYDRMYGTRDHNSLENHSARDPGCEGSPPQDGRAQNMYSRLASPPAKTEVDAAPDRRSIHAEVPQDVSERARLYDILVFVLFGLLVVLAMHEIAALGEAIGKSRSVAATAARNMVRTVRTPRFY